MAIQIDGDGIGVSALSTSAKAELKSGRKNLIINGGMDIWQRGTTRNPSTSKHYLADRFSSSPGSGFNTDLTVTQSTESPSGFSSSMKMTPDTVQTPTVSYNGCIRYDGEGFDFNKLGYGTTDAKTMTVSFWVRSNKTGTYCFQPRVEDTSRNMLFEYTIDTANTWEKKVITIVGDTDSTIPNDNGFGLSLIWHLATGPDDHRTASSVWGSTGGYIATSNQVNFLDSTANEFYLTGIQLEVGDTATDFEHRSYGEELALCKRYCQVVTSNNQLIATGHAYDGSTAYFLFEYEQEMRTSPSISTTVDSGNGFRFRHGGSSFDKSSVPLKENIGKLSCRFGNNQNTVSTGSAADIQMISSTAKITLDAEL